MPDIVQQVLSEAGLPSASWDLGDLSRGYTEREYVTQWKESEFVFVSRLLEDEGILYAFTHADDGHVLVAGDGPTPSVPSTARRRSPTGCRRKTRWRRVRLRPDAASPSRPTMRPRCASGTSASPGPSGRRWRRSETPRAWSGWSNPAASGNRATAPGERKISCPRSGPAASASRGDTNSLRLLPGRTFELTEAMPPGLCRGWTVRVLEHTFTDDGVLAGRAGTSRYRARFELLPDDVPFRPPRRTPRPSITAKESAVVVGPKGEEIDVDAPGPGEGPLLLGPRREEIDDKASCWIRDPAAEHLGGHGAAAHRLGGGGRLPPRRPRPPHRPAEALQQGDHAPVRAARGA